MIPDAALDDLRARNSVTTVAGKWVALRRSSRAGWLVGPCPLHSSNPSARDSTSFECNDERWVCASCADGGDVIKLVMLREGRDFRAAVEWLGGAREADPDAEARRALEAAEKQRRQESASARFREEERRRCHAFWREAMPIDGTAVEAYLRQRGLLAPRGAHLRCHPAHRYVVPDGRGEHGQKWRLLHTGPAMLAAITAPDGHFLGLHQTWLDLDQPKGKLRLVHPETGEALPAKKMRGSKQGGHIDLLRCAEPARLIAGEGIETVLAVYTAMVERGRALEGCGFRAAGDLGNLAGKATGNVKAATGRARVPGPEPDLESRAMVVPDSVTDLRLLADGDSDPHMTRLAMQRAAARHACEGRRITVAWPAASADFNKMLKPEAA